MFLTLNDSASRNVCYPPNALLLSDYTVSIEVSMDKTVNIEQNYTILFNVRQMFKLADRYKITWFITLECNICTIPFVERVQNLPSCIMKLSAVIFLRDKSFKTYLSCSMKIILLVFSSYYLHLRCVPEQIITKKDSQNKSPFALGDMR